jgi:hypothetical protein
MWFAFLVMLIALTISSVAIYYSVAGLVAIFAAAAVPIIIMGGALEIGKLVAAVWLHKYWSRATWWLKSYLSLSVLVLMFITSMGIFGFLSKAHIEQTATAQEGVAQIERINTEIARQEAIIARSEQKIERAESSSGDFNADVQAQIDAEQERIDNTYARIQPAIDEQNRIIAEARSDDESRIAPYNEQLSRIDAQLESADSQIRDYEERLSRLQVDTSAVEPLLEQITSIEEQIARVQGQLASGEREQIRQAQATIGVNSDGSAGPNTRRVAGVWESQQRERIGEIQGQIASIRQEVNNTIETERVRLRGLIEAIRSETKPSLEERKLEILATIDEVRLTESPAIQTARDEIARIRSGADQQIAASQALVERLRNSLQVGVDSDAEIIVDQETQKIAEANNLIDSLTEEKYALEAEYRKLEAEVGPVKYLAEFIYGENAGEDLLEEAVRWVIIVIIFVFDPLAVVLLIASQYTFEWNRKHKPTPDIGTDKKKSEPVIEPIVEEKQEENHEETIIEKETTSEISSEKDDATEDKKEYEYEPLIPELEEMLKKADEETLEQVKQELEKEQRSHIIEPLADNSAKRAGLFRFIDKK